MKRILFLLLINFTSILFSQNNVTAFLFSFENTTDVTTDNMLGTPTFSTVGTLTGPNYFSGQVGQAISYSNWNTDDGLLFTCNTTGGNNLNFQYSIRCSNTDVGTIRARVSSDLLNWSNLESDYTPTTSFVLHGPLFLPSEFGNSTIVYIELYKSNNAVSTSNNIRLDEAKLVGDGTFPVELTSFTSSVIGNKVNLNWETATEVNNFGFDVQRKSLNDDWMKIGFVQGNGNSNSPKSYSFTDQPTGGKEFQYRLKQIDFDGGYEYSSVITATLENVNQFVLDQNFPNPFNPVTKISYTLPQRSNVRLKVYDMLAKEVAELVDALQEAGRYEVTFDGSKLSSGTYFYRLDAGAYTEVKKLILIK